MFNLSILKAFNFIKKLFKKAPILYIKTYLEMGDHF
jgi:hypothetical protein